MGIQDWSENVILVDLQQEPDMGDELKTVTEVVRDRGDCDVVIDFSDIDIVTSSSLSKMLKLRKLLADCGHRLIFSNVAPATKGIFTVTRKHVPFRTITNISSKKGLFDRFFGIGSVHIETAGYSGSQQQGPESKLEGIVFYEEVRDFILNKLRKFREPYVIGTEMVHPIEEPVPRMEGLDDEILITLREIRDILKNKA